MRKTGVRVLDSGSLQGYCNKCKWSGLAFVQASGLTEAINAANDEVLAHTCPPKPRKPAKKRVTKKEKASASKNSDLAGSGS